MTTIEVEDARAGVVITGALTGNNPSFAVPYMEDDIQDLVLELHGSRCTSRDVLEVAVRGPFDPTRGLFLLSRRQGKS